MPVTAADVTAALGQALKKNAVDIGVIGTTILEQKTNSTPLAPINYPFSKLQFPEDLKVDNGAAYMDITFQSYKKNSQTDSKTVTSNGGLRLPLPTQLVDNKSVSYDHPSLGPFLGTAMGSLLNSGSGIVNTIQTVLESGNQLLAAGAASLAPNSGLLNAASAYTGTAFNPYQTVLFKTPNFRKHSFSWRFIPRNESESATIQTIVNLFNTNLLPGIGTGLGSLLFQFPSVLNIQLYPSSDFLYKFKPCVIESVSANYAPGQTPAFYRSTGAPAAVDLKIDLLEIELWTRNDYDNFIKSVPAGINTTPPSFDFNQGGLNTLTANGIFQTPTGTSQTPIFDG
jgi:hypothetical protein